MSEPFFSIIIPAYNEEKYLPLCLDSINNLDYPRDKYEVIVVDNGSQDRTRDIAVSKGVTLLCNDSANVSGLRNLGVRGAQGDILAFVDADCVVSKDWLKCASKYFDSTDIAAWGSPARPPGKSTWVQRTWYLVRQKGDLVQTIDWLETMNLFVRKNLFNHIGGFNEGLSTCEDVDLCYRICKYGKLITDGRLKVVHYGEAGNIKEFFKKEMWRGSGNLRGTLSHGFRFTELPSIFIPIYFGLFLPLLLILCIYLWEVICIPVMILLMFLPGIVVVIKLRKRINMISEMLQLLCLIQVYFIARTVAAFNRGRVTYKNKT